MKARFTDRVMVVTGAAQGIGKRVAELAAAEGARQVLVDMADYVLGLVAELREQGIEPKSFHYEKFTPSVKVEKVA